LLPLAGGKQRWGRGARYNGVVTTQKPKTTPPQLKNANEAARHVIDVASDRQASDIVLLDVRGVSGFADYMVIMSANSARQVRALADELEDQVRGGGLPIHHREGTPDSGWILLDFGDLVVHVFSETQREFYRLEQVWKTAKELVRLQ
jgi:ribosome-associated protein